MVRKKFFSIGLMLVFLTSFTVANTVQARPPPEVVHFYRYLVNDASYAHSTSMGAGGTAYATHGDISDIGMYTSTVGWFSWAQAINYIDGGRNDNSPWTFSYTKSYGLRVYWEISGTFNRDHSNYFKFDYTLYHMSGSTKVTDMSKTYTYTSSFNYNAQSVNHYVATTSLTTSEDYFLECTITLYHSAWSIATSDMYFGADSIEFVKADFYATFYYW